MNFINSLGWFGWSVMLAIPPLIILLYFLKLKRIPVVVPSTYLWSRAIEDLHVNTIWQRLRRNVLLWLQLLFVGLLMLALLRPGDARMQASQERLVLLIDQSASMSARAGDSTRLDVAKSKARELIDSLSPDSVAMIIAFSRDAQVVQSYTNNRALLRRKLDSIQPTQHPTDLDQALRAAAGLANPPQTYEEGNPNALRLAQELEARLLLLTDGGVKTDPEFALGNLRPEYLPIGLEWPVNNVGIVAFSTAENPEAPGNIQAFAQILNAGDAAQTIDFELYLEGRLIDAVAGESFDPGELKSFTFDLSRNVADAISNGVVELRLTQTDDLDADNRAFAVFNTRQQARILLITPGDTPLEVALATDELRQYAQVRIETVEFLESPDYQQLSETSALDLIIYDRCQPEQMPLANTLFWGRLPPGEGWQAKAKTSPVVLIDVDQSHPLVEWLQMGEVLVAEGTAVQGPPGTLDLIQSNAGSMLSIAQRLGFQDAVVGFELITEDAAGGTRPNTDWPRHPSFPMFLQNVVNVLGNAAGLNREKSYRPGETVELRTVLPHESLRIEDPVGRSRRVSRGRQNRFVYSDAEQIGIYSVFADEATTASQRFAVHLVDRQESQLQVPETLDIGFQEVAGGTGQQLGRVEYWKPLLLLGLLVLAVEWYIFNRRVYV